MPWVKKGLTMHWEGPPIDEQPREKIKRPYTPRSGEPAKCGTVSGARRHHRLGEECCDPCKIARQINDRKRYHEAKARYKALREEAWGA